jgi:putative oxidoreductase
MERRRGLDLPGLLVLGFRLVLGGMFVYAGVTKILDPAGFAQAIANYRLLPPGLVNIAAIVMPWVEVLAGASLILGASLPGGSLLVAGLLLVFACALGIDLLRGLDISCGCFGSPGDRITWLYVLRDALLCGMACFVWVHSRKSPLALDDLLSGK